MATATKRVGAGSYVTPSGYAVERVSQHVWHLVTPSGDTLEFPSKTSALEFLEEHVPRGNGDTVDDYGLIFIVNGAISEVVLPLTVEVRKPSDKDPSGPSGPYLKMSGANGATFSITRPIGGLPDAIWVIGFSHGQLLHKYGKIVGELQEDARGEYVSFSGDLALPLPNGVRRVNLIHARKAKKGISLWAPFHHAVVSWPSAQTPTPSARSRYVLAPEQMAELELELLGA